MVLNKTNIVDASFAFAKNPFLVPYHLIFMDFRGNWIHFWYVILTKPLEAHEEAAWARQIKYRQVIAYSLFFRCAEFISVIQIPI